MVLWVAFAVLTAAAVAAVVVPLWRGGPDASVRPGEGSHDLEVYKQQLRELDADLARGLIAERDAEAARIEIARRLLAAADATTGKAGVPAPGTALRAAVQTAAIIAVPALALTLYGVFGAPDQPDQPLAARLQAAPDGQPIQALVARVEERLRAEPGDGRGWSVLAPVYLRLGRFEDAVRAFERANRLLGDSGERLAGLGEALILAGNGVVSEPARQALMRALEMEPQLAKARIWLAVADEQDGRFDRAAERYRALLQEQLPEDLRQAVAGRLAELPGAAPASPGPTAEQMEAIGRLPPSARAAMIEQMVEGLAERLRQDGSDLAGWLRLVRAYVVLGRRDDAATALATMRTRFAGNDEALGQIDALARSLGLES